MENDLEAIPQPDTKNFYQGSEERTGRPLAAFEHGYPAYGQARTIGSGLHLIWHLQGQNVTCRVRTSPAGSERQPLLPTDNPRARRSAKGKCWSRLTVWHGAG